MTSPIKGWLVERDGRTLFLRELVDWAIEDPEYKVTALIAKPIADVYEQFMVEEPKEEAPSLPSTDDTAERLEILEQIYELEEKEIALLKERLEEAVELVESIHEFASKQTNNIMESRGLLLLIAESCQKWLKPRD